jgi:XTP/dITP diphosphohydrolase
VAETASSEPPQDATPAVLQLVDLFARLRRECAWKAAQTHRSLTRYLLEEAYEAVDAIDSGDPDRIRDELGDVLLQVHLHAAIAAEAGTFDMEAVAAGLRDKMVRRNPHVFGGETETDPDRIDEAWQRIKAAERRATDPSTAPPLDEGIPAALPALVRATKVLERLARTGPVQLPEPPHDDASAELGHRLLALVEEARRAGVDPEQALRQTLRDLVG